MVSASRPHQPFDALPAEVDSGQPLPVWCELVSGHVSDRLHIARHDGRGPLTPIPATPAGPGSAPGVQRWQAVLPPPALGETVHCTPTLTRAGLVVATAPARSLRGVATPAPAPLPPSAAPDLALLGERRYEWASEFLGAFTVQLAKPPESFGPGPNGLHITFYIASGEIRGPRINARIRGEGGDWMLVRRDGVGMADVRITYETDDGALLLSCYYGVFDLGPDGYERALRNDYDPVPPLVLAPQFNTSHPNWLWLNRLQCLAVGRVTMAELKVRFDLYAIRAGQPLPASGLPRVDAPPLVGDIHR